MKEALFKFGLFASGIVTIALIGTLKSASSPIHVQSSENTPMLAEQGNPLGSGKSQSPKTAQFDLSTSQEIIGVINLVRQNPKMVLAVLQEMRRSFNNPANPRLMNFRGMDIDGGQGKKLTFAKANFVTFEGVAVINDAIQAIQNQTSVPPIQLSAGMSKSALAHSQFGAEVKKIIHVIGNSTPGTRLSKYGKWEGNIGENMITDFPHATTANLVLRWIIDDGIPKRIHRKNIFSNKYKTAGAGCALSNNKNIYCTVVFVSSFVESAQAK